MTVKIGTITYVCLYFNALILMIHNDITSLLMITVTCLHSHFLPKFQCLFVTEEIQYHGGLRSRELGQAPILLCGPNS